MIRRTLALLALAGCAAHGFRARDWAIQGSLAGIATVDGFQSRHITAEGAEDNPLVGDHGQRLPFPVAGAIMLGTELLVSLAVADPYRLAFESFALGAESYCVGSNFLNGWYPW